MEQAVDFVTVRRVEFDLGAGFLTLEKHSAGRELLGGDFGECATRHAHHLRCRHLGWGRFENATNPPRKGIEIDDRFDAKLLVEARVAISRSLGLSIMPR